MRKAAIGMSVAAIAMLGTAAAATAGAEVSRNVSVLGRAEIDTHDPASVFDISVHAWGNGHSGKGVIWMSHHYAEQVGWLVARVDCVRSEGPLGIVTAVVADAQDFAGITPRDPINLTVRDNGTKDSLAFASGEQVKRCHRSRTREHEIARGDFQMSVQPRRPRSVQKLREAE
ncbi:hypothetical protein GCM10027521_14240 [Amycolatopsis cihanbeyliensis]